MPFKICTIGCGAMAANGHGPSYKRYSELNTGVELAACCDLQEDKAREFMQKFGFKKYYTDIDNMLDTEKPDVVCLVAPVSLTMPLSIKVMEKGYPIIMEKPPGLNREETLKLIGAAEKFKVPNQVAFNRRYTPVIRAGYSILNQFKPEEIENIRYDFYRVGRNDEDFSTTAIHGIDTVKYLARSDYEYVNFTYQELTNTKIGNIFLKGKFKSGATFQINFCPASGIVMERAAVSLYSNTVFIDVPVVGSIDVPGRVLHLNDNKIVKEITGYDIGKFENMFEYSGFYAENAEFFNCIREGRKPEGDIKSGLQSVEIADCIRKKLAEYNVPEDNSLL